MRTCSTTSLNIFQLIPPSNTSPNLFDNRQALPPQEIYPPMVSSVKAAAAGKVAAVKKEEVSPPKGDGQLSVMLAMGIAIIFITLRLADYLYEAPGVGETIFSSFIKTPLLGTGVNGDLFLVSFSYVPLMWLCIFLRNNGIGASVLKLKDVYNVVMTAFSLYCFLVMAAWRFRPEFEGEAHGKCETAISHSNAFGSFQLTAELFFWSKYVEWIDSVFLLYNNKPISVLHGFHHLGAPIAMGSMVAAKAEFVWIFVLWNSFIHTISTCSAELYTFYPPALLLLSNVLFVPPSLPPSPRSVLLFLRHRHRHPVAAHPEALHHLHADPAVLHGAAVPLGGVQPEDQPGRRRVRHGGPLLQLPLPVRLRGHRARPLPALLHHVLCQTEEEVVQEDRLSPSTNE